MKTLLDEANVLIEQGTRGEALNKIAIAFAHLIDDYKESKFGWKHQSRFFIGHSLPTLNVTAQVRWGLAKRCQTQ